MRDTRSIVRSLTYQLRDRHQCFTLSDKSPDRPSTPVRRRPIRWGRLLLVDHLADHHRRDNDEHESGDDEDDSVRACRAVEEHERRHEHPQAEQYDEPRGWWSIRHGSR